MTFNPLALAAAGVIALAASPASAAVTVATLDFDDLTTFNSTGRASYSADGYSLTPAINTSGSLWIFSSRHPYNGDYDGATISQGFLGMPIKVARQDGGLFSLKSIDLTDYFNAARSIKVAFSFTDADGAVTSQVFTTDALRGLQTFAPEVKNLRSFSLVAQGNDYVQFDNIVLSSGSLTNVPEPATWGLMLMGFFGLGSALRNARRASPRVVA